jgi:excisionase family DNA binding protein
MAGILDGYDGDALLTTTEVAALFRVDRRTVARWSNEGKLLAIRTLGGHRRFRVRDVCRQFERVENIH